MKRFVTFPNIVALAIVAIGVLFGSPLDALAGGVFAIGQMMPNNLPGQGMRQNFPNLSDFKAYMVNKLGEMEVIRQSLYDTIVYPTAGVAQVLFFQNPIGQGLSASPGNAGAAKQLSDTNMTQPGTLPAPQAFWVQSVELDFQPGSSAAANTFALQIPGALVATDVATAQAGAHDVNAFYSTGALRFTVGTKPYLEEAALLRFPPKARFEYEAALSGGAGAAATLERVHLKEKLCAGGRPYNLEPGVPLMTSQNFNVTLLWPVIVPTPSGFNGAVRCILDGWLFRSVQ